MRYPDAQLQRSARSAAASQSILVGLLALPFAVFGHPAEVVAVAFGGFAVAAGTAVYAWKLSQAVRPDGSLNLAAFYQGALLKVLLTVALLVLGLGPLHLEPLTVLFGAAAAYVALLFVRTYAPRSRATAVKP